MLSVRMGCVFLELRRGRGEFFVFCLSARLSGLVVEGHLCDCGADICGAGDLRETVVVT